MARVHNMNEFKALVQQNNLKGITWQLGDSEKYIKTLFCNGMAIVNNCQQYNMSGRNHELFEILQANMGVNSDMSASESRQLQKTHSRGNRETQNRTYVKGNMTWEALEEALLNTHDAIDNITDNDIKEHIAMGDIIQFIQSQKIDYSYPIDFIKKYHCSWNNDSGNDASTKDLLLVAPNRVATKVVWEKVMKLEQRARELMGV